MDQAITTGLKFYIACMTLAFLITAVMVFIPDSWWEWIYG